MKSIPLKSMVISLFTGRNEVVAKVIVLHLFVILFTGGGGVVSQHAQTPLEQTPPRGDTPREQTHPHWSRHPPRADPPSRHPPRSRPPGSRHRPGADTPPPVNERPVHILLECILVLKIRDGKFFWNLTHDFKCQNVNLSHKIFRPWKNRL